MECSFCMLFAPQTVDTGYKKASEQLMADASWDRVPVNQGRVQQLFRKGGWSGRLYATEDGSHREAFRFGQIAIGIRVRRALAG